MRAWTLAALDLVFPAFCPACRSPLGAGRRDPLCGACWAAVVRIAPPLCARCGCPVGGPAPEPGRPAVPCGACSLEPPAFDYARAPAVFAGPLREAVHALKFGGHRALARPLAALILEQCGADIPFDVDALVPVPLAGTRLRERGFNQAELVAARLGAALGVPVERRWLRRERATRAQTELTADERRANVRGAFAARPAVAGRHVIVIDDVLTTGATVGECARVLREAGAARVGVLTVARVPPVAL